MINELKDSEINVVNGGIKLEGYSAIWFLAEVGLGVFVIAHALYSGIKRVRKGVIKKEQ